MRKGQLCCLLFGLTCIASANFLWSFSIRVNINPFIRSPDYKYEFKDIKEISNWYSPSDSDRAFIEWNSSSNATVNVPGFCALNVKDLHTILEKGHPSVSQTIYSMSYMAVALEHLLKHHEIADVERNINITRILDATDKILNELQAPFPLDSMKMNDHARSVRAEYLALLIAYLESNPGLCSEDRIGKYRNQLNEEIYYLMDPRLFTWHSNHGLMQIRSQIVVARMMKDCELKDNLTGNAEQFIQDTIHYLVANDGAVLEAASSYWFYIYQQIAMIYDDLPDNSPTANNLHAAIERMLNFLLTISIPGGYYQGLVP